MKRKQFLSFIVVFCVIAFGGCQKTPDAQTILRTYESLCPLTPSVTVSLTEGTMDKGRLEELFGTLPEGVTDVALLFLVSPDTVGECGVIVCRDRASAMEVEETAWRRVERLRTGGLVADVSACDAARVFRNGCAVGYTVLPDENAPSAMRKALRE